MFERAKSFFGCLVIEANEIVQEMKERGVPPEEIVQAIGLWLEKEDFSLLVRVGSAPSSIYLSTPAMARAGWEIPIRIGGNMNRNDGRSAECPECAEEVRLPPDTIVSEVVECPTCGAELEVKNLDPPVLGLAPQPDEDWGE